jgi:hypothetical protein
MANTTFYEMRAIIPDACQDLFALALYGLARTSAAEEKYNEAKMLGRECVNILEKMGHRKAIEVRQWLDSVMV